VLFGICRNGSAGEQERPRFDFRWQAQNMPQAQSAVEPKDPDLLKIDLLILDPGKKTFRDREHRFPADHRDHQSIQPPEKDPVSMDLCMSITGTITSMRETSSIPSDKSYRNTSGINSEARVGILLSDRLTLFGA